MDAEWYVKYFDPELGRAMESRRTISRVLAISIARDRAREGCTVRFIMGPRGEEAWDEIEPKLPRRLGQA